MIKLSPRQEEIAHLLAQGKQSKIIAHELGIASSTVSLHLQEMMKRYVVSNRLEFVLKWLKLQGRLID